MKTAREQLQQAYAGVVGRKRQIVRAEQADQIALVELLTANLAPGWRFFHVPNGGKRTKAEAGIFKAMGVDPGVEDLVFVQRGGLVYFLELKAATGKRSKAQIAFHRWCIENDVPSELASDPQEAIDIVQAWGALKHRIEWQ
jgi:hypothetical protein